MFKRTQQTARETKQEAKDVTKSKNGLFASCSFSSLGLDPKLSDQLQERMGFEAPTLVQAQSIPVILSGRDVYLFFFYSLLSMIVFVVVMFVSFNRGI